VLITIHLIAHQHTYIAHHTSHSLIYNTSFIIYLIAIDVFFGSTLNRQGSEHSNRKRCLSFKASKVIIESCHRWTSPLCQFYYLYLLSSSHQTYTPNIIQLISALLSSSTSILIKSVAPTYNPTTSSIIVSSAYPRFSLYKHTKQKEG